MNIGRIKPINIMECSGLLYTFAVSFSASTGTLFVKSTRVLIFAIFAFNIFRSKKLKKLPLLYYTYTGTFFAFCCFSIIWAVSRKIAVNSITTLLYIIIINWILFITLHKRPSYIVDIFRAIIWGAIFHAANIYLQFGLTIYLFNRGGSNGVENANTLAYVTSIAVILCIVITSNNLVKNKHLYHILLVLNIISAILTASRKVFLFIGVFVTVYYILKSNNSIKIIRNIILVLLALLSIMVLIFRVQFLYTLVGSRIETMIIGFLGGTTDSSVGFRLHLIEWGIEWFKEKPLIGHGIDCYKFLLGTRYSNTWVGSAGVYAHNNYIELLVDVGLLGTVLYYAGYVLIIGKYIKIRKLKNNLAIAMLAIVLSLLVTEYGQISYSIAFLQEVIMLIWFIVFNHSSFCKY
ncbi:MULTISPECIES: O-antigen ligase [Clostridia]|uniref:O-antigen ligase family protein n=1 Tax=Clostridia TaxID=186801 RepID=UPI00067EEA8B|nr:MULTISPECIES: O-antigen ligase family protein [Clostridia]